MSLVALVASSAPRPHAQVAPRRAASPAALLAYPGFYQGQLVVVRGNLVTRDQPVLLSPSIERSIPLIFSGPSPVDGPVELRASFWDVGRLQREDPRIATLGLDRLLPRGLEGDWPRPGEVVALTVTDAMAVQPSEGAPSLRQIALNPSAYIGQTREGRRDSFADGICTAMRRRDPASASGTSCSAARTRRSGLPAFGPAAGASISMSARASTRARGSKRPGSSARERVSCGSKGSKSR